MYAILCPPAPVQGCTLTWVEREVVEVVARYLDAKVVVFRPVKIQAVDWILRIACRHREGVAHRV